MSTGKQADGAQARFPALPNNAIGMILERGSGIAQLRGARGLRWVCR